MFVSKRATDVTYRIHLDGFTNTFASASDMQAWVSGLKRRYPDLIGKVAKVWRGKGTVSCATYDDAATLIVVGA